MRLFDAHVHIFPDALAARAVATLAAKAGGITPVYDGSRAGLEACMRRAGIGGALNCPIATKADQVRSINDWAAAQNRWPVLCLGTIHPDFRDMEAELRRVRALGLRGIKLHPEYQEFYPDDPRLTPVWEICSDLALPVLFHAGGDIGFPPPYHCPPSQLRDLLARHPRLQIVAAHFGGWRMWEAAAEELFGLPVWLDLAFLFGELPPEQLVAWIRRHGAERVLFATDAPWHDPIADAAAFAALPLTAEEQRKIGWKNAADLFGFTWPE